jgi:hypothetical protein
MYNTTSLALVCLFVVISLWQAPQEELKELNLVIVSVNTCHSYVFKFSNRQLAEAMVHAAETQE